MQNLKWINEGNRYILKNGEEVMVDLLHSLSGNDTFFINKKKYSIVCKGFWNPRYEIKLEEKTILRFSYGIWKNSGTIVFADGSQYQSDYRSKNGLKMRFLDNDSEIMVYSIEHNHPKNVSMGFYVGIVMEDAEKLLILAALGMSVFSSQLREMISGEDLLLLIS